MANVPDPMTIEQITDIQTRLFNLIRTLEGFLPVPTSNIMTCQQMVTSIETMLSGIAYNGTT